MPSKAVMDAAAESTGTMTLIGAFNASPATHLPMPTSESMSLSVPGEIPTPSLPLPEGAVRLGDSLLAARVPEVAFRRDPDEEF